MITSKACACPAQSSLLCHANF